MDKLRNVARKLIVTSRAVPSEQWVRIQHLPLSLGWHYLFPVVVRSFQNEGVVDVRSAFRFPQLLWVSRWGFSEVNAALFLDSIRMDGADRIT